MLAIQDLKKLSPKELNAELKKARLETVQLRLQHASNELKGVHAIKAQRRYIAQILTIRNLTLNPPSS